MDGKLYPTSEHAFQASKVGFLQRYVACNRAYGSQFLPDRPALAVSLAKAR